MRSRRLTSFYDRCHSPTFIPSPLLLMPSTLYLSLTSAEARPRGCGFVDHDQIYTDICLCIALIYTTELIRTLETYKKFLHETLYEYTHKSEFYILILHLVEMLHHFQKFLDSTILQQRRAFSKPGLRYWLKYVTFMVAGTRNEWEFEE